MIRLVPVISGLLGWWIEITDVIHPVEETTACDGALKSEGEEVAQQGGEFPYLDQTLRRCIGDHGLKNHQPPLCSSVKG